MVVRLALNRARSGRHHRQQRWRIRAHDLGRRHGFRQRRAGTQPTNRRGLIRAVVVIFLPQRQPEEPGRRVGGDPVEHRLGRFALALLVIGRIARVLLVGLPAKSPDTAFRTYDRHGLRPEPLAGPLVEGIAHRNQPNRVAVGRERGATKDGAAGVVGLTDRIVGVLEMPARLVGALLFGRTGAEGAAAGHFLIEVIEDVGVRRAEHAAVQHGLKALEVRLAKVVQEGIEPQDRGTLRRIRFRQRDEAGIAAPADHVLGPDEPVVHERLDDVGAVAPVGVEAARPLHAEIRLVIELEPAHAGGDEGLGDALQVAVKRFGAPFAQIQADNGRDAEFLKTDGIIHEVGGGGQQFHPTHMRAGIAVEFDGRLERADDVEATGVARPLILVQAHQPPPMIGPGVG